LLAAGWTAAGCEQIQPYRQGVNSTYRQELRQLAEEVSRKELAKTAAASEVDTATPEQTPADVTPVNHWHASPLVDAIRLKPPVAWGADVPIPPP
jgi:hypothetical protein